MSVGYLGQALKEVYPTTAAIGGANMGQVPLFSVQWCPNRAAIWAGYVAADGQELDNSVYPDATNGIAAGNVPLVSNATWLATLTERGKYVQVSSTGKFRMPDYNGKFSGSIAAVFLRGDGVGSALTNGTIQQDAMQGHIHQHSAYQATGGGSASSSAAASNLVSISTGGPVSDGTNGTPRTTAETRPTNVTGCWVVKLFGAITNTGAADAAALATAYGNLVTRTGAIEAQSRGFATAWVNFNGAATTIAIRDSYNVASITDNGVGNYTVNFTTTFTNANYAAIFQCTDTGIVPWQTQVTRSLTTTSSINGVSTGSNSGGNNVAVDATNSTLVVYGGK